MSRHRYVSHLRRGAAAFIDEPDTDTVPIRFAADASLVVNDDSVRVPVTLFGPGDITALCPQQIRERFPAPGSVGVETNYFPHLELNDADLPWRFTPTKAANNGRLRPWLVLITVERRPGLAVVPAAGDSLPVI